MYLKTTLMVLILAQLIGCASTMKDAEEKIERFGNRLENSTILKKVSATLDGFSRRIDSNVAKILGNNDVEELESDVAEVVSKNEESPQDVAWKSDSSEATGRISTTPSVVRKRTTTKDKIPEVDIAHATQSVSKTMVVLVNANVRSGPGTEYGVVTGIPNGQIVHASGKTDGGWYLLDQSDVAIGYIRSDLVRPRDEEELVLMDLDSVPEIIELDTVEVESQTLTTQNECRTVTIKVDSEGTSETDVFDVCKDSEGVWQF